MNGESASAATESLESTPATVPSAPTSLSGYGYNGWVSLSWTAPSDDGGADISDYEYQYSRTSQSFGSSWTSWGNTNTLNSVFGLTNGTGYKFRIRAVNSAGESTESRTAYATPATIPSAPQNLNATAGDGEVSLYWDAPNSNGGLIITDYEYSYREGSSGDFGSWTSAGIDLSETVTGLTNDTLYEFRVRAVNSVGAAGSESDIATGTPQLPLISTPGAPQNLQATAGDGQVTLSWDTPSSDGGGAITGYEYRRDTNDDGSWRSWASTDNGSSTSVPLTGLTNGTVYAFKVRAVNSSGSGPESSKVTVTPQSSTTVPGAPTNLRASTHSTIVGAVYLSWDAPSDDGGTAITGYEARFRRYYSSGWSAWTSWFSTVGTYTFVTVTERTGGELYGFQVRAVNSEGEGGASNIATATAKE